MHRSAVRRERSGSSSRKGCVSAVACCTMRYVALRCNGRRTGSVYVGLCFRMTPVIYAGTLRTLRRLHVETCIGSPAVPLTNGIPKGLVGAASHSLGRARGRVGAQQRVGG